MFGLDSLSEGSLAGANCHPSLPRGLAVEPKGDKPLPKKVKGKVESASDWRRLVIPAASPLAMVKEFEEGRVRTFYRGRSRSDKDREKDEREAFLKYVDHCRKRMA